MQRDSHAHTGSPKAARTPDPMTGRVLERRYRIGGRIARGGMASVYEALDLRLDRTVAVKIMHPGLGDDEEFAARFVREARSAARLSHPNVVAVFDQGADDGTAYLAMELVRGHTLRDTIRHQSPMSSARALSFLEPVVSALAAAHRAGLVHRDVKPENVLIAEDGRVKVADFGLARAVSADTQHTSTGVLIGTVSYIAPELVIEGRSDARADVYAVGVMLYELLTGTKPHEGETPIQVAYKHVHEDVPMPSSLQPAIPAYVDALVARATARQSDLRAADAGVLLHQLHRVAQALADGVDRDDELVADLRPRTLPDSAEVMAPPSASPAGGASGPDSSAWSRGADLHRDTASDPWDAAEMAALLGNPPAPTSPELESRVQHPTARLTHGPASSTPSPPVGHRPRRRRRGPVLLALALLLAGGVGAGAWWVGYARWTTTPGVIGLTSTAAGQRLSDEGLKLATGEPAYSGTVPAGRIISTDPPAGDRVLDHATVQATMSLGVEEYRVPKLTGRTRDGAAQTLAPLKMQVGTVLRRWSETVPKDQIIGSRPRPGVLRRPGTTVALVVSKGRHPIPVGDWVGKYAGTVEAALHRRGLVVDDHLEAYSDNVMIGHVISQAPSDGTLFRDETVTLTISKGPELVEMPAERASGVDAATEELQSLGFQVKVEQDAAYIGLGYVLRTDPQPGKMVPRGSTVTLYLV